MKKTYKTPAMKVVAVKVERMMCQYSITLDICDSPANDGEKAWGKEECEDEIGW